ncbi:MAG: MFS transporter, partial [Gammaproteobacteria bacterium]|nr:MFS transporter [Gammaproteobacteria bacterium]
MRWQRLTRSLRHPNYRIYFFGQLVSLNGTWMQNVAQAWLVYRLTESSFMLGLVSFLSLAPVLVFGLFGGVIADRLPRFRLFLGAQVLACLQALIL